MKKFHLTIAFLLFTVTLPLAAESFNPPTKPQPAPLSAQVKKNLDMVMTWWRGFRAAN